VIYSIDFLSTGTKTNGFANDGKSGFGFSGEVELTGDDSSGSNAATPEPATLLIFGLGLAGLGLPVKQKIGIINRLVR